MASRSVGQPHYREREPREREYRDGQRLERPLRPAADAVVRSENISTINITTANGSSITITGSHIEVEVQNINTATTASGVALLPANRHHAGPSAAQQRRRRIRNSRANANMSMATSVVDVDDREVIELPSASEFGAGPYADEYDDFDGEDDYEDEDGVDVDGIELDARTTFDWTMNDNLSRQIEADRRARGIGGPIAITSLPTGRIFPAPPAIPIPEPSPPLLTGFATGSTTSGRPRAPSASQASYRPINTNVSPTETKASTVLGGGGGGGGRPSPVDREANNSSKAHLRKMSDPKVAAMAQETMGRRISPSQMGFDSGEEIVRPKRLSHSSMPRKNSGASADTRLPNLREESPGFSSSPGSQPAIQHKPSSRSSRPAGPGESTTTPPPTQPNFSSTPNASSGTTSAQPVQIPMPPRSNLTALRDLHRDRGDSSSPSPAATPSPMGSLRHHPHHHHHGHPPHLGRLSELANSASEFTGGGGGSGSVPPIVSTPPGASMRRPSLAGGGPAPFAGGVGLADLGSGGDYFPVPAPPAHGITGATPPSAGGVRGPSPAHPEEVVVQGGGGGGPSSLSTSYQSGSIHTRMAGSGVSVPIGGYSHPREREPKEKEKEKEKDPAPAPTTDGAGGSRSTRKPSHGETTLPSTTGTGSMRTTITVETYRPGDSSTITTPARLPSSSSSTVPKQQQQQPSGSATKQIQQQFTGGSSATSVLGMTPNRKPSHAHLTKPSVAAATGLTTATVSAPPPSTYVSPQTTGVNTGVTAGPGGPSRQTSMANLQHQYASTQAQRERVPSKPKDKEGTVVPSSARPSMATPLASTPSLVQQVLVTRSASQSQRQPPQDQPRRVSRETNASQAQPQPQTSTSAAVPVTRHHSDVPTTRDREREPVKATKTELPHTTSATAVLQTTPATASTIRQGQDTTPARAPQRQQQPLKVAIPAAPTTAAAAQPSPSSTDQERSIELSEEEGGRSQPQSKSGSRSQSQSQSRSRGGNSKSGSRSATSSAQAQQSQSQPRTHTLQNMASSQTFSATTSASGISDRVPYPPLSSATTEHDGEAIPDKSLPSRSASQSRQTSPRVPYPPLRSQASVSVMSQSISAMGELRSPPRVARPLAGKAGPASSQRPGHSRTPSHTAFSSNTRPDPSNDHDRERAVESRIEQLEAAAARQAPPSSTPAVTTEAQTTTMMVPIEYRSPPSVPADIQARQRRKEEKQKVAGTPYHRPPQIKPPPPRSPSEPSTPSHSSKSPKPQPHKSVEYFKAVPSPRHGSQTTTVEFQSLFGGRPSGNTGGASSSFRPSNTTTTTVEMHSNSHQSQSAHPQPSKPPQQQVLSPKPQPEASGGQQKQKQKAVMRDLRSPQLPLPPPLELPPPHHLQPRPTPSSMLSPSLARSPAPFVVVQHPSNPWAGISPMGSTTSSLEQQDGSSTHSGHSGLPTPEQSPPQQLVEEEPAPPPPEPSSSGNLLGLFGVEPSHGLRRKASRMEVGRADSVGVSTPPDTPRMMAMQSIPQF